MDRFTGNFERAKVIGLNQVLRGLDEKIIGAVVLAANSDKRLSDKVLEKARRADIPVYSFVSKEELGKRCSIDVACAVVGFIK